MDEKTWALKFINAKVLVVGNERGMDRFLDFMKAGPQQGRLGPIIGLAELTKHTAMIGFNPTSGPVKSIQEFAEIRLGSAMMDVSDQMVLDGRIEMPNVEAAKKMQRYDPAISNDDEVRIGVDSVGGWRESENRERAERTA